MAKKNKTPQKKDLKATSQNNGGFGLSMADLLAKSGLVKSTNPVPSSSEDNPTPPPTPEEQPLNFSQCGKLVLRIERKNRGGKTVTFLNGLDFPPEDLKRTAKTIGKALGCGAGVEGDKVVIQGDQLLRAHTWLQQHGAPNVVLGSRPNK